MKKWLTLPLLVMLTACVSYYRPQSALEDGVYYAEDDPSYRYNSDDFYYVGVVNYPWYSLDYFYFGYWPYPHYGFGYYYPYGYGFAALGYPYGYGGYYDYFSPWNSSWYYAYYHDHNWRPWRKNCHHHGGCREHDGDDRHDRYAGEGGQVYGYPGTDGEENAFYSNNTRNKTGYAVYPPAKRHPSRIQAGSTGYQVMVPRNYQRSKADRSRARPDYPAPPGPAYRNPSMGSSATGPSAGDFPGHSRTSPSFGAPTHRGSSGFGKSPRQKDRD